MKNKKRDKHRGKNANSVENHARGSVNGSRVRRVRSQCRGCSERNPRRSGSLTQFGGRSGVSRASGAFSLPLFSHLSCATPTPSITPQTQPSTCTHPPSFLLHAPTGTPSFPPPSAPPLCRHLLRSFVFQHDGNGGGREVDKVENRGRVGRCTRSRRLRCLWLGRVHTSSISSAVSSRPGQQGLFGGSHNDKCPAKALKPGPDAAARRGTGAAPRRRKIDGMAEQEAPGQAEAPVAAESAAVLTPTDAANKAGETGASAPSAAAGAPAGAQHADPSPSKAEDAGPPKPDVRKVAEKPETRALAAEMAVDHASSVPPADVNFGRSGPENRCGLLGFRPDCLQPLCRLPLVLADLSFVMLVHNFLTNGVVSVVLPTLERRFQLKSFESAMILSSYNVANVIAVTPVSFLGTSRSKPMFVAFGAFTVGTGSLMFASAHLLAPAYAWGSQIQDLCPMGALPADMCQHGNIRNYRFLLMAAHAINGLGSTPFFTLSVTYMDENVPSRKVSTYLGEHCSAVPLRPMFLDG
ncbi:hypothetical protein HPB48_004967 [Haemaphysalis longicornis]|uniref:Major facilitator superfamily (MFS) profile domain-containing protein n=1 Tax=Haemaphysalis longicornis TaxID=44386 RepID=A0A9J6G483_HAELO|nr:hypothetical protein HPB48_004967 [Haemaphysalis longicornis]